MDAEDEFTIDVSLQLMRGFVQTNDYGINNWPNVNEFAPLIASTRYCKVSLIPTTLETADGDSKACVPLPPLYEQALPSDTKSSLGTTLCMLRFIPDDATFEILKPDSQYDVKPCVTSRATHSVNCEHENVSHYDATRYDARIDSTSILASNLRLMC